MEDHPNVNNDQGDSAPDNTLKKLVMTSNTTNTPEKTPNRSPRRIQMQVNQENYDVIEDLNQTKCNITFGQLLDAAPKLRSQVTQGLKLERNENKIAGVVDNLLATTVMMNNISHTYKSKSREVSEDDIAMVDITVEGVKGKALIDSCSNLSIITKQFLEKLPSVYQPIGISRGRIRLATNQDDYSENYVVQIPIKINNLTLIVNCRIVDKEDPFFDIIINLKTQVDNKLFIHPMSYSLCQYDSDGLINIVAPINNDKDNEEKILCVLKAISSEDEKQQLKEIEGLTPLEYINHENFTSTLDPLYRNQVVKLLL